MNIALILEFVSIVVKSFISGFLIVLSLEDDISQLFITSKRAILCFFKNNILSSLVVPILSL